MLKKFLLANVNLKKLFIYSIYFAVLYFVLSFVYFFALEGTQSMLSAIVKTKEQTCKAPLTNVSLLENKVRTVENELLNCNAHRQESIAEHTKEFYVRDISKAGWTKVTSGKLGIIFKFLVDGNSKLFLNYVSFPDAGTDPRGAEIEFSVKPNSQKYGGQQIAVGSSKNLLFGRDAIEPDVYKWLEEDGKAYLLVGDNKITANNLAVYPTKFNTKALLYDTNGCFGIRYDEEVYFCEGYSRRLIVNFPENYNSDFESIRFVIPDYFTQKDIQTVLDSIELINTL